MDEFRIWQEDYRREVDEVLASMRGGKSAPSIAEPPTVVPPAGVMRELAEARAELERLRPAVDELRHELALREASLAKETRRRGRFKEVAEKMQTAIRRLDEELSAARRRLREDGLRARDLAGRLRAALQERRGFSADRELDKKKILQWAADARVLQGRVNELELACDAKQSSAAALEERLAAAQRRFEEQAAAREAKIAELVALRDTLSAQRGAADAALRDRALEGARVAGERDAVFKRLQQTLSELKVVKDAAELDAARAAQLASELAKAREDAAALRGEFADAGRALEQALAELAQERTARRNAERENADLSHAREERDRLRAHITIQKAEHEKARQDVLKADAASDEARRLKLEAGAELAQARELARQAQEAQASAEKAKLAAERARLDAEKSLAEGRAFARKELADARRAFDEEKKAFEARQAADRAASQQSVALAAARQAERRRIEEESRALLARAEKVFSEAAPAAAPLEAQLRPIEAKPRPKLELPPAPQPEQEKPKGLWGRVKKLWEERE